MCCSLVVGYIDHLPVVDRLPHKGHEFIECYLLFSREGLLDHIAEVGIHTAQAQVLIPNRQHKVVRCEVALGLPVEESEGFP
jgi:hypothetical protein